MQALYRALHVVFVNHKTDVNLRCALRDHAHVDVGNAAEYLAGDARLLAQTFADQANNGLAAAVFHVCQFLQIAGNGWNGLAAIHSERNADLGG